MHRPLIPVLALLALAGCADRAGSPTGPDAAAYAARRAGADPVTKPWKGRCDGVFTFTGPTTLLITGTCRLTPLGRVTFVRHDVLVLGPVVGVTSTTTYTAANGDLLHTTTVGTATPTADGSAVMLAGTETAVGGTGRFEHATGSATLTGQSILAGPGANTGFYELRGTLIFAAPDRER